MRKQHKCQLGFQKSSEQYYECFRPSACELQISKHETCSNRPIKMACKGCMDPSNLKLLGKIIHKCVCMCVGGGGGGSETIFKHKKMSISR